MRWLPVFLFAAFCVPGWSQTRPAPEPRGVYLLHQGRWSREVIDAFQNTPFLDGASIRVKWSQLEPRDQQFEFTAFDEVIALVRKWNQEHPDRPRNVQIRPMAGVHTPTWLADAGVRFYDTHTDPQFTRKQDLHIPVPYENPAFLGQLRELYQAMLARYQDEQLVVLYHGTWSAGPWDEIFHPTGDAPLPPDYSREKFVRGMLEQLDVLIDEICLKGKAAELPFSGMYPPKSRFDITGPLVDRAVERLGRESPFLFVQSNGWGITSRGRYTISWGHEDELAYARGKVRIALQALGTNAGGGWIRQGDWLECVKAAEPYQPAYLEIYPPSLTPMDRANHIEEAMQLYRGR